MRVDFEVNSKHMVESTVVLQLQGCDPAYGTHGMLQRSVALAI